MSTSLIKKYGLAIHSTTPQLGIALDNFTGDRRSQTWDLGRDLSCLLHLHLQEILHPQTWDDLQFISVAKGPGGFTGTRIGVVTARTLGQQLNIPVYGISNLAAIAYAKINLNQLTTDFLIAVQMNTRREQLFVAIYQVSPYGLWSDYLPDTTMTEFEWDATLANLEHSKKPWRLLKISEENADSVESILFLAYLQWQKGLQSQWAETIPFYGQQPV